MFNIQDPNYAKRSIKIFIFTAIIFLITFVLAVIFSPSIENFKNMTDGQHGNIARANGLTKVWEYIINNGFKVPSQMFIFSLIPIPFLYFLNLVSTTITTGIVFGFVVHFDKGIIMVLSSIPHTIIEILAMCLVISGLYKVSQSIIRKISNIFRKTKKQNLSFKLALSNVFKIYFLIALPLYILAGFIETYLTDFIYNLFKYNVALLTLNF